MQTDLGLPGTLVGLWARYGSARRMAVVPGNLDQEPAGVTVAGLGDVATVLLLAA